jgi:O-antigen biosynthesis protein WbqP
MKRALDILLSLTTLPLLLVPFFLIALTIRLTSTGPVLFWSTRVGQNNKLFEMPKFRTMRVGTPLVATNDLSNPASHLTKVGSFLRKTSLDELPQLLSILKGDMSFVGPRPALFNQYDLIALRTRAGVDCAIPGLTGWAQVNGRDELSLDEKVRYDLEYVERQSIGFDLNIIAITAAKVFKKKGISH